MKVPVNHKPGKKRGNGKPKQTLKEALTASEIRYRRLFESAKDGILILDFETEKIIDANPFMVDITGFSLEEILGKKLWEIGLVKNKEQSELAFTELKANGYIRFDDMPVQNRNGNITEVEIVSNVYPENNHKVIQCNIRDITEHKHALEALKSNEQKFTALAEQSPNLIFINYYGRIVYVNKKSVDTLGYSMEEFYADNFDFFKLIADEYQELTRQNFSKHLQGIEAEPHDYVLITKNGKRLDVVLSTELIDYEGSKAVMGTAMDITERKRTEAMLSESERKTRALLDAFPDLIFRVDREGTFLDYKADKADLYSQSEETIIGKKNRDITPPEFADLIDRQIRQTLESGKIQEFEYQMIHPKRGPRDYEARMVISGKDEVIAVVRDITERKQMEEALKESQSLYHSFIEQLPNPVFRKDREGCYVFVNSQFCKLKGLKEEDFIGKKPLEIANSELKIQGEQRQATKYAKEGEEVQRMILQTGKLMETEEEYRSANGSRQYMHVVRMPVIDSHGTITGTQGIMFDITERKLAEEETQKNEQRFRNLFENSGIAIWEADLSEVRKSINQIKESGIRDFRLYFDQHVDDVIRFASMVKLLDANKEILNLIKAKNKKQALNSLSDFFIKESVDAVKEVLIGLAEEKLRMDGEIPLKILTGEIKQVLFQFSIVSGEEDTWAKGIISFIDITDKKNTEQALKESENQIQEILENVDDVFYMMSGRNGRVIYINSAYEKIWKRPVAEIMKNPETWLYAVHPEDVNSAMQLFEQGSGELQYRIILPDGSIRWIWDRMFPILDEKGEIAYLCGMAADITERKFYEKTLSESEAKLDEAMKIAKLGTWEYDVVHDQFKFNDQFYALLHTTVEQEGGYIMSAKHYVQKFVHPDDISLVSIEIQKSLKTTRS